MRCGGPLSPTSIQGCILIIARRTRFTERHYGEDGDKGARDREISPLFGRPHPFPQVQVNREWLTASVVAVASSIYEDRAFDRLPILADVLEEAGCGRRSTGSLPQLRSPRPGLLGGGLATGQGVKRPNHPLQQTAAAILVPRDITAPAGRRC